MNLSRKSKKAGRSPGEFRFIRWIASRNRFGRDVTVGIGDDCAVFKTQKGLLAVTTDMLVEGVDFVWSSRNAFWVGWKSLAVSVSDVAAMGMQPVKAVACVAVPPAVRKADLKKLYNGIKACADCYGVEVIGGDVSSCAPGGMTLASTVLGRMRGKSRPVTRAGGREGDVIAVTGALGGSILGRHLRFEPRVDEALWLNRYGRIHSMIDLSDGLSGDLAHVCEQSGVGAVLSAEAIPISAAAVRLSRRTGKRALDHALHDGEDFELLFTLSEDDWRRVSRAWPFECKVNAIGRLRAGGISLAEGSRLRRLVPRSFAHSISF